MSLKDYLLVIGSLFTSFALSAAPYRSDLDQVQWQLSQSSFECKITTQVTALGEINFIKKAGYPEFINVLSAIYDEEVKRYRLGSSKAPWGIKKLPEANWYYDSLSLVNTISSAVPKLIRELQRGAWGHISLTYVDNNKIYIVLPSVNLEKVFDDYYQCLKNISPFSYDQVRDRNIYYAGGIYLLNSEQKQEILDIAKYISLDSNVTKVLIDGHSNSVGNLVNNLLLSQQRADDVYMHLVEAGISPDMIEVRSHGDRYPLESNRTQSGREKNRRVNLRIIRGQGK